MEADSGSRVQSRPRRTGCLHVAAAWLVGAAELIILACCLIVMYIGMKTNGLVFTETVEKTRRETWTVGSTLTLASSCLALIYFLVRCVATRTAIAVLLAQVIVVLLVIAMVIWFHSAIPVPPHTYTTGIPAP